MIGALPHKPASILDVTPYLKRHYAKPGNGMGGCFHIMCEDPNPEPDHARWCLEQAAIGRDNGGEDPISWGTCDDETVGIGIVLCCASTSQRRRLHDDPADDFTFYPDWG